MKAKLQLSRAQLAAFLSDPDSIRAFETLFSIVDMLKDIGYVDGANGKYLKLGNSIALCWGYKVISDGDAIVFPITFAEIPGYVGPVGRSAAGEYNFCQPNSVTASGFTVTYKTSAGAAVASKGFNWIAIGKI